MACIYRIINTKTGKFYIGSSQKPNPFRRKSEHWSLLRKNRHYNPKLQNSWNKHGEAEFLFEIMELLEEAGYQSVTQKELEYINNLSPFYNICKETRAGKLGRIMTEETRQKMVKNRVYHPLTEETKTKIRKKRALQVITEAHKKAISKALKGRNTRAEAKHKLIS